MPNLDSLGDVQRRHLLGSVLESESPGMGIGAEGGLSCAGTSLLQNVMSETHSNPIPPEQTETRQQKGLNDKRVMQRRCANRARGRVPQNKMARNWASHPCLYYAPK